MPAAPMKPQRATFVAAMGAWLAVMAWLPSTSGRARAQAFTYSNADLATVRVFALKRIEAQRIRSGAKGYHTIAVPVVSHGSGMVVTADGLILTAHHVVAEGSALAVRVPGRERAYPAQLIYADPELDFAFLSVPGYFEHVAELPVASRALRVREPVHAVGYPVDPQLHHPLSSPGIIAGALGDGRIQLGISLNPGNSGGPLLDADEAVIGIVVARGDPSKGVLGLGVATPIAPIRQAFDGLPTPIVTPTWTPATDRIATLVVQLAVLGPVGLLREAGESLRQQLPLEPAQHLEALAGAEGNADLLALSAAFTWDALVMRLVDMGSQDVVGLPVTERTAVMEWLRRAIQLCHQAVERDPSVRYRSGFVGYVVERWPHPATAPRALPHSPHEAPAMMTRPSIIPTAASSVH